MTLFIHSPTYNLDIGYHIRRYRRLGYMFKKYNMDTNDQFVVLDALTNTYIEGLIR